MAPTDVQIARLYDQYGGLIYRRCLRILRNPEEASDAMQEVFARAICAWDSWGGEATRLTWLSRIATNHCLNVIRNSKGRREKLEQRKGEAAGAGAGLRSFGDIELLDVIRAVMEDMDEDLQRLATLYYFDEMTQAEIAEEVGLSVPTVRKRLRAFIGQARKNIKKGLETQVFRAMAAGEALILAAVPLLGGLT